MKVLQTQSHPKEELSRDTWGGPWARMGRNGTGTCMAEHGTSPGWASLWDPRVAGQNGGRQQQWGEWQLGAQG